MRVAVLAATCLPWHRFGGLERHVFQLCRWLRKRVVEVDLFTAPPECAAEPFPGDAGFRHLVVPGTPFSRRPGMVVVSRTTLYPAFSLRMGARVVDEAGRRGYSAVIAQGMTGFGYAVHAKRATASPPLILNPQGMEEALTPNLWKRAAYAPFRALTRFAARGSAAVVATDEVLVPAVESLLGIARERIAVIPNAIDVEECRALADHERAREALRLLGAGEASPLVVSIGRLAANKGLEVSLAALASIAPRLPDSWRWVIVGDGPRRAELEQEAARRGIAAHVRFAGTLADAEMHGLLAIADLFLHATLFEGSSLVTLEAMSHARPIVATRAGGIPDKIEEGVTGWLAEPASERSLADAILRWHAADPAERSRIGTAAEKRCRERFDWPVCVDRYLSTIENLVGAGR